MYVLGEGVFGYARDKGVMCMCIRTSNCRPVTVSGEDRVRGRRQDDCVGRGSCTWETPRWLCRARKSYGDARYDVIAALNRMYQYA